ncbi:isoprenylcysteine carboxylmethyltransferase family protein [Salipaludibacillus agaradhaerens]|uniref:Isoprenylcysteine carboxylmethyltransferase family protein n=1 Tax=Salipaludibacillus agaradhaerens TaxID=76935 RepID=A0A9Q4AZC3_SALAG|nr:methyltransferase [Salipaludibacillus agaradhaerens]MCR6095201.1 isoprenylcysteine carboxylmethyltransferase family protein [Salipaludibacillus agaradhaerens]MCR6115241.1 isoprenylcysteine carboxylmethyltransferase family protein [Salipaludibacillus agaradhaerens]
MRRIFPHHTLTTVVFSLSLFLCYLLKDTSSAQEGAFIKWIGISVFLYGGIIRCWTYRLMYIHSRHFHLPLYERPLYTRGPYRHHRHPLHTSLFLMTLGSGLLISNHWLAAPLMFLLIGSALHPIMREEEQFLAKKYGDIYACWCKHRFRLLPFFY